MFVFGAIMTYAVYYSIPAHADPVLNYTAIEAPAICGKLDANPTLQGVTTVIAAVAADSGFPMMQVARVVVVSVETVCPRHLPLLQRFVDTYAPGSEAA
jgi:hypothetical protein